MFVPCTGYRRNIYLVESESWWHHQLSDLRALGDKKEQEGNGPIDFRAIGQWIWLEIWNQQAKLPWYPYACCPNSSFVSLWAMATFKWPYRSIVTLNLNSVTSITYVPVSSLTLYCWLHKIFPHPFHLLRTSFLVRMSHWRPELRSEVKM